MGTMQKERLRPLTVAEQRELTADHEGEQRAGGSGAAGDGAAGGGPGASVRRRAPRAAGYRSSGDGHVPGAAVQPGGAGRAADRGGPRAAADLRRAGPRADRGDRPAPTRPEDGRHRDLVAEHPGADAAPGGAPAAWARRRSGACCTTPAVRTSGRGPGARRARPQRKRKAGVVQVADPQTEEKRGPSTWPTG